MLQGSRLAPLVRVEAVFWYCGLCRLQWRIHVEGFELVTLVYQAMLDARGHKSFRRLVALSLHGSFPICLDAVNVLHNDGTGVAEVTLLCDMHNAAFELVV